MREALPGLDTAPVEVSNKRTLHERHSYGDDLSTKPEVQLSDGDVSGTASYER